MTIEELRNKIKSDKAFQAEFENAVDNGTLVEWATAQGVNASENDLIAGLQ